MTGDRLKIKVCGMRDACNISAVAAVHPDYMGFIFYPPSPRYCSGLNPDLVKSLAPDIIPVAVTVDMSESETVSLVEKYGFKTVQLHGNESPELCRRLIDRGLTVFKAIPIKDRESLRSVNDYEGAVNLFVFDTATPSKGGSGLKFNWNILEDAYIATDFLLSGGIGPEDKEIILGFEHPHFIGVDINSRFEVAPGIKDVGLLRRFMKANLGFCFEPMRIK